MTNAITNLLDLHTAGTQFCKEVNKANYYLAVTCGCQNMRGKENMNKM